MDDMTATVKWSKELFPLGQEFIDGNGLLVFLITDLVVFRSFGGGCPVSVGSF